MMLFTKQAPFKRGILILLCLCQTLTTASCKRRGAETGNESVSWPELTRFDKVAFRAEGFVRAGNLAAVRESYDELLKAGRAMTPATIPSNASDPQQVALILRDLTSLLDGLASEELNDSTLTNLVLGLHPVTAKLSAAAGMPHVHH